MVRKVKGEGEHIVDSEGYGTQKFTEKQIGRMGMLVRASMGVRMPGQKVPKGNPKYASKTKAPPTKPSVASTTLVGASTGRKPYAQKRSTKGSSSISSGMGPRPKSKDSLGGGY